MLAKLIFKILANAGALFAAVEFIPGVQFAPVELFRFEAFPVSPLIQTLLAGGAALAIVNGALRPVANAIGAILPLITGALLTVVLNVVLLYAADAYLAQIAFTGLAPLLWSGLLLGIVNTIL